MSAVPGRDLHAALTPLLDALVEQASVHSVCLWEKDGGEYRRSECRGAVSGAPGRFRPDADTESWLASSGPLSWRVTDRYAWERPETASDGRFHLAIAVSGLLLEVATRPDVSDADLEAVLGLVEAFGGVVAERRGRVEPGPAAEDSGPLRFVDLTFVESVAMGDRDFVFEILAMSESSFRAGWETIREELAAGALAKASSEAHRLRSTARTVGASRLDDELLDLERAPDLDAAHHEARRIRLSVETVLREIRWLLETMR